MTATPSDIDRRAAYLALALSGILWGTSFVLGKIAFRELDVPHAMFYRFLFAALSFVPLLVRVRPRFSRSDLLLVVAAAVFGVPVQFLMQFGGLAITTVAHAALMIGTAPVLIAIGGFVFFHERLGAVSWLALLASTAGVVLIVGTASPGGVTHPSLRGDLLVVASIVAGASWVLISKHLMRRHSPREVTTSIIVLGSVLLIIWVLATDGTPPTTLHPATWIALLGLGVANTTCTTLLWNWGLRHTDAGRASAFINFEPAVGAILGVWLLHDSLGAWAILGAIMIIGGALAVSLDEHGDQGARRVGAQPIPPAVH